MNTLQQIEEDIKEFLDKELKEGEFFSMSVNSKLNWHFF